MVFVVPHPVIVLGISEAKVVERGPPGSPQKSWSMDSWVDRSFGAESGSVGQSSSYQTKLLTLKYPEAVDLFKDPIR